MKNEKRGKKSVNDEAANNGAARKRGIKTNNQNEKANT